MEQNSPGLLGLSHYRSSRVATSLYEPIYLNLFTVQLTPPKGMGIAANSQDVLIMLEGVKSVSGLETSIAAGSPVQQTYKFAQRSFAGSKPDRTTVDLTINFELNLRHDENTMQPEEYTFKFLRAWNDLIYDPLTGRQGLKRNYVAPNVTITQQDRNGTPFHQWILYNVFPTSKIDPPALDYNSGDIHKTSMTWRCDYWDEAWL